MLNNNGKIYFLMTLQESKSNLNQVIGFVKPYLKYLSTVDFGKITYESDFDQLMSDSGMKILEKRRCSGSIF